MANDNPDPESNGVQTDSPGNKTANTSAQRKGSDDARKTPAVTPPVPAIPPLRAQSASSLARVSSPSPASSPRTSRNASPVRKDSRTGPLSGPISTQPSAAAIQRALSAANAPQLQQGAVVDAVTKLPRPPRSGETTPHWPTSPRLKSPPPSAANSRRGSSTGQKKTDTPSISVQTAPPQTATPSPLKQSNDEQYKTSQLQTPVKGPSRGASGKSVLETVQEDSAGDVREPSPAAVAAAAELKPLTKLSDDENQASKRDNNSDKQGQQAAESGSESAGTRSPQKRDASSQSQRPKNASTKSYASLTSKSRSGETKQGMTVETETVPSVPQSALNVGDRSGLGRGDNSGSIKQKPSSEAIRPKKDRKRTSQKARSINSSTVSSKADIFEQRVANAVDEANSSESDETFVYESNPPEPQRRARHHSRTPSVASSHSVADQQRSGMRNFGGEAMDDSRRVAGKRSMKFSNNAHYDPDSPEGKDGSVRSHTPRHFGRFGRGGSHQSMFDPDSPFTQASKLRSNQRSKPGSPRSPQLGQQQRSSGLFGKKQEASFDFDGEVGDDERTPLVGTVRTQRNSRSTMARRLERSPSIDEYYNVRRRGRCSPCNSWPMFFILLLIVLLISGVFLVMSNRPLYNVELLEIKNVLASEQELILDLWVTAVNPNAFGIAIADMDLDIFAKSKHVGSGGGSSSELSDIPLWIGSTARRRKRESQQLQNPTIDPIDKDGWQDLSKYWRPSGGVDKGTDPPNDDRQTMLLGRVFRFDSALSFSASPLQQQAQNSTGELRLAKPGNKTETGGSARWERVLQNDFELIVRGSLKYQLPISSRLQSVAIGNSVIVHPEGDVDKKGNMLVTPVDHSEHWQWVEWEEVRDAA